MPAKSKPSATAKKSERRIDIIRRARQNMGGNPVRLGEKIATVAAGLEWFHPYIEPYTQETAEMRIAYRKMLSEATVKSSIYTKVLSVASLDTQVQPGREDSPKHDQHADFIDYNLERTEGGLPRLADSILKHALIDGVSICEKVVEVEDRHLKWANHICARAVKAKDTTEIDLVVDKFQNITGVRSQYEPSTVWNPKWFVITSYAPLFENPSGMSDLRAAYSDWWMLDTCRKLRAIHNEKWTTPFLVGWYKDPADATSIEAALEGAKANTWMRVPEGVRIEAMKVAMSGESDYKSWQADCERRIVTAINGAYLQVLEGQITDARGNAQVSKSISELYQWMLVALLQESLNRQWVPWLIDLNFGPQAAYPKITLGGVNQMELQNLAGTLQMAKGLGLPMSKKWATEQLAIQPPDPDDPDDELSPEPGGAAGGMGMGGGMGMPSIPGLGGGMGGGGGGGEEEQGGGFFVDRAGKKRPKKRKLRKVTRTWDWGLSLK